MSASERPAAASRVCPHGVDLTQACYCQKCDDADGTTEAVAAMGRIGSAAANRRYEVVSDTGPDSELEPGGRTVVWRDSHAVQACYDNGEGLWTLVCDCQWEAWGFATEQAVRSKHADHVLNPDADEPVTVTS